jgi:hypothetical protein
LKHLRRLWFYVRLYPAIFRHLNHEWKGGSILQKLRVARTFTRLNGFLWLQEDGRMLPYDVRSKYVAELKASLSR